MNENINIVEILKNAPNGTKLWSPLCGECYLRASSLSAITVEIKDGKNDSNCKLFFAADGKYFSRFTSSECLLFPSKENRDWRTFKASCEHKHFEPFQKVLVASAISNTWEPDIYRCYDAKRKVHSCMHYYTIRNDNQIIPYKGNENKLGKQLK